MKQASGMGLREIEEQLEQLRPMESAMFWGWARWMLYAMGSLFVEAGGTYMADIVLGPTAVYVVSGACTLAMLFCLVRMAICMKKWWPYGMRRSRLMAQQRRLRR